MSVSRRMRGSSGYAPNVPRLRHYYGLNRLHFIVASTSKAVESEPWRVASQERAKKANPTKQ